MKYLFILIVLLLSIQMVKAQKEDCGLDSLFTKEFTMKWKQDSTGQMLLRGEYYKKIFAPSKDKKRAVQLQGKDLECIYHYFGKPNIIREKEKEVVLTYFVSLSWIDPQDFENFEGIVLQIIVTKKYNKVTDYYVMLT